MELPDALKKLYRHWNFHTEKTQSKKVSDVFDNQTLFEEISYFIAERNTIWKSKSAGAKAPYTNDPVLSRYRFCNVFREFDRQTIEFHTLLAPLRDDFPLWLLNMFYCRMVARTETIERVGLLSFDAAENKHLYERLMNSARPRFGTPYVFPVSVIQKSTTPTREKFIAKYLPSIMQTVAGEIATWKHTSVYDGVASIIPLFKFNLRFLWTEVLIDVAYQFPEHINLFDKFPVGPGALPTMQRIDSEKDPSLLAAELSALPFATGLTFNGAPLQLSAENWEGIGCEFRKYTNLKSGKGRKRIYTTK